MTASSRPERILLISDLHLEEDKPSLSAGFRHFLEHQAAECSALYILGDFLNLWIGDDDERPLNRELAELLRDFAQPERPVFLMHGNRDFLLGEDFARRAGITLIPDPYVLPCASERMLLMHGDQLCTRDTDYQTFRATVRAEQWQRSFLAAPLAERRAFAEQARAASSSMSSNKADDIMDVTRQEVEKQLRDHGLHTLIHGHTHRPAVHEFELDGEPCRRIVLGDWGERGWYVELLPASGEIALRSFPIAA